LVPIFCHSQFPLTSCLVAIRNNWINLLQMQKICYIFSLFCPIRCLSRPVFENFNANSDCDIGDSFVNILCNGFRNDKKSQGRKNKLERPKWKCLLCKTGMCRLFCSRAKVWIFFKSHAHNVFKNFELLKLCLHIMSFSMPFYMQH